MSGWEQLTLRLAWVRVRSGSPDLRLLLPLLEAPRLLLFASPRFVSELLCTGELGRAVAFVLHQLVDGPYDEILDPHAASSPRQLTTGRSFAPGKRFDDPEKPPSRGSGQPGE